MHSMVELYSIHKGKDNTLFIVCNDKIIVQTKLQEFKLSPEEWDNGDKLEMIAYFIKQGTIKDMGSLRRLIKGLFTLEPTYKRHNVLEVI